MKLENILIVDDDNEDSEFFVSVMHQLYPDMNVIVAETREELFDCLEKKIPDVLFIDSFIQMDSGIDSIKVIRDLPLCSGLPVIMYTGSTDMKTIGDAFNAGATSYFVKPGSLNEIKHLLSRVLNYSWLNEANSKKTYYANYLFHDYLV